MYICKILKYKVKALSDKEIIYHIPIITSYALFSTLGHVFQLEEEKQIIIPSEKNSINSNE